LIHQENLWAISLTMTNGVPVVIKLHNFIQRLIELQGIWVWRCSLPYEVYWLGCCRKYKSAYDLKSESGLFLETKAKPFPHPCDHNRTCDLRFAVTVRQLPRYYKQNLDISFAAGFPMDGPSMRKKCQQL
jgi:hypothetical protein